jgi:hypothetical protein
MFNLTGWPGHFSAVISCTHCTTQTCSTLLRDSFENVPQPGFIGCHYDRKRVLLVGQNPAITKSEQALHADMPYTKALRTLRENPTGEALESLLTVARDFMPTWRMTQDYFPLKECGLSLDELAYVNLVRCRTGRLDKNTNRLGDARPNRKLTQNCVAEHFSKWVELLAPRVIVFLGKFAWDDGQAVATSLGVPADYLNRQRSRSGELRQGDRDRVAALVRGNVG